MVARGMALIFLALGILVLPGMMFNAFAESGLNQPGEPNLQNTIASQPFTVQGQTPVGCQVNTTGCDITQVRIPLLNPNSPYTFLFAGDIAGFIGKLASPTFGTGNSINFQPIANGTTVADKSCVDLNTKGNSFNPGGAFPVVGDIYLCNRGTLVTGNQYPQPQYIIYTNNGTSFPVHNKVCAYWIWGCSFVVNWVNPTFCTGTCNALISSSTLPSGFWDASSATITNTVGPASCTPTSNITGNFFSCILLFPLQQAVINTSATGTVDFAGVAAPVIGFLMGVFLLILGLGMGISAGGLTITGALNPNRQGTKLAQVLGFALIVWSFFYSEFSAWFNSGILPVGLDGPVGIISVVVTGCLFFGVYDQATTD